MHICDGDADNVSDGVEELDDVIERVSLRDDEKLNDAEYDELSVSLSDSECVPDRLAVSLREKVADSVLDQVAVRDTDTVPLVDSEVDAVRLSLLDALRDAEFDVVIERDIDALSLREADGESEVEAVTESENDGVPVAETVDESSCVGDAEVDLEPVDDWVSLAV